MDTSLQALAEKTLHRLREKKLKLATAESCTGGGLGYFMTAIAGSSDVFERGFVTYSNLAKQELLGVRETTLNSFGAVSKETACEMAVGVLQHSAADVSVAITGIAGPSGGSREKPVGTVWIACAGMSSKIIAESFLFTGDREAIRQQALVEAFKLLFLFLKN